MRLRDDYDDHSGMTPTIVMTVVAVTLFVAVILVVVLLMNSGKRNSAGNTQPPGQESNSPIIIEPEPTVEPPRAQSPEDFDFWDKYPPKESKEPQPSETAEPEKPVNDPATDGRHTLVRHADGKEEWVLISPHLPKHEYDFTRLVCQSGLMKYYENGKQISYVGVDVSKLQDYIDFTKVKKAGIQFVMIRGGARGYGTGQLIVDEYFLDNLKRATDAGLDVGIYFYSQAITKEEAVEEAALILENIGEYKIAYPIAYDMELITNDTARTDSLSKSEKTNIAKAFLKAVEDAGYKSILYGNKEWLIKEIDMSKLTAYDVWLSQQEDIPDYPYRFTMWQYDTGGTVDGIAGPVNMNISFIDYSEK